MGVMDVLQNSRYERFAQEYVIDSNGTQAAIRAGYAVPAAGQQACELLKIPNIAARIRELQRQAYVRNNVTQDRILEGLARIAFADIRDIFGPDGALLPMDQWTDDIAHVISSLEVSELKADGVAYGVLSKVKQESRIKALELLGKYMELFTENVKHTHEGAIVHLRPGDLQTAGKVLDHDY